MRIIGIGERKIFFAKVQEDNGNEAEIALDRKSVPGCFLAGPFRRLYPDGAWKITGS